MGLEFLGNPYEYSHEYDSDNEIEIEEEWVVTVGPNDFHDRLLLPINGWPLGDMPDFSMETDDVEDNSVIDEDEADDLNVSIFPPTDNWPEDDESDFSLDMDNDDDCISETSLWNEENEENEDDDDSNIECDDEETTQILEQYNKLFDPCPDEEDSDGDSDLDYVTYPFEDPDPPEQPDQMTSKSADDSNVTTNISESSANLTAHSPSDDVITILYPI